MQIDPHLLSHLILRTTPMMDIVSPYLNEEPKFQKGQITWPEQVAWLELWTQGSKPNGLSSGKTRHPKEHGVERWTDPAPELTTLDPSHL